ncbi:phage baseplate assembly protein V [Methylobacillus caricis]|uniref:phage baseplate assembly protein V n=1 Tax=Methylobacillus caricis TaxID=1971611 RepID=UPI001CFFB929|nr:phage baseplate assembly protein V [Methylobacillus caricis]MCB5187025.1 phage baseplate assembly protein V [Methylobacillus caricis]
MTTPILVINGARSSLAGNLKMLRIEQRLNALPNAYLQLEFDTLNAFDQASGNLLPNQLLEIHADSQILFQGKVQQQKIKFGAGKYLLTLICWHQAAALQTHVRSRCFAENSDSQTIHELLAPYGIKADIESSTLHHHGLIQHNISDWDFLLQRLNANGLVAYFSGRKLIVTSPVLQPAQGVALSYQEIISLDIAVDGNQQTGGLKLSAWNSGEQSLFEANAEAPDFSVNDRLATATLVEDAAQDIQTQHLAGEFTEQGLQTAANARLTQLRLAAVQGKISALDLHHAAPGQTLNLDAMGTLLSGNYYISGVTHEWPAGAPPQTNFELGLSQQTASRPTSNTVSNLLIGKVIETGEDPAGEARIKITCPLIDPYGHGTWARLIVPEAGHYSGTAFMPEAGSEVMVGFTGHDLQTAVVFGAFHSSAIPSPFASADQKGYVSHAGMNIIFDENQRSVSIETPSGNGLAIADEEIILRDRHANRISMGEQGIRIESQAGVSIHSTELDLAGQSRVKVESGGITAIKGSLVHIN